MVFSIRIMNENVVAAIAAVAVPVRAEPDKWPVQNSQKISMNISNSLFTAYSLFKSCSRFFFTDDPHSPERNGPYFSYYICGADNSLINAIAVGV
jgi:hypothetical protein